MRQIKVKENPKIVNNCLRYEHLEGYPYPATASSCKGCRHSYDPDLYDAGCKHPEGLLPRDGITNE